MTPTLTPTFQTIVQLAEPVSLQLSLGPNTPRTASRSFSSFPLRITADPVLRTLTATLSPLPRGLQIYGPEDYAAAAGDTMADHAERVLHCLGTAPAAALQAMVDGSPMPARPVRVPREIANWRAKAVLASMGRLATVEAIIAALPEPQRTIVQLAWAGDAKLERKGATVLAMATALAMDAGALDELFIAADGIVI